jgi:SHO1 osmosensor
MYAYSASPDDPNEVSFAKGDMLDVLDATGKWFQVRAPSGQTGVSGVHLRSKSDADGRLRHQTT